MKRLFPEPHCEQYHLSDADPESRIPDVFTKKRGCGANILQFKQGPSAIFNVAVLLKETYLLDLV